MESEVPSFTPFLTLSRISHPCRSLHSLSCSLLEETEIVVPMVKEPSSTMETDEAPNVATPSDLSEADVDMQDAKGAGESPGVQIGVLETGEKPVQMETDSKAEAPKTKVKKTNIPVSETIYGALLSSDLQKAVEKEFEMALQDCVMEETKDQKNAVEAHVYDIRNKIYDTQYEMNEIETRKEYFPFTTSFINLINALIANETDFTDGGLRFVGAFQFVYDNVFGPLTERAYADPSKKWQLVVACLQLFKLILAAYDVKGEDLVSDAGRLQSQMQLPVVVLMKDFMSGKTVFRNIRSILMPGGKVVTVECTNQVYGKLLKKAVHLSLDIITLVLKKDLPLSDCWRPAYQHLDTLFAPTALLISSLHEDLFDSCGTTIFAFTRGGSVFAIVDSRSTSEEDHSIRYDDTYKYMTFDDILPNTIGIKCGSRWVGDQVETAISEWVTQRGRPSFEELATFTFKFLQKKSVEGDKVKRKAKFSRASTILTTVDSQGPKIALISLKNDKIISAQRDGCIVCGSGGVYAEAAFNSRGDYHELSDEDCIKWAMLVITYAIYRDVHSGGPINACHITLDRPIVRLTKNPVHIFLENFEDFMQLDAKIFIEDTQTPNTEPEDYKEAVLFVIHPSHLSHDDVSYYLRIKFQSYFRRRCSWGTIGNTRMELSMIIFSGDATTACTKANELQSTAIAVRARHLNPTRGHQGNRHVQMPRHHYGLPWIIHDKTNELIFVGRAADADLRKKLLADMS